MIANIYLVPRSIYAVNPPKETICVDGEVEQLVPYLEFSGSKVVPYVMLLRARSGLDFTKKLVINERVSDVWDTVKEFYPACAAESPGVPCVIYPRSEICKFWDKLLDLCVSNCSMLVTDSYTENCWDTLFVTAASLVSEQDYTIDKDKINHILIIDFKED